VLPLAVRRVVGDYLARSRLMMRIRDMRWGFIRDHVWTRRHLDAYLDGELDPAARRRVERHSELCPPCHRLIATLKQTLAGLRELRDEPSAGARGGVAEAVIGRLRDAG
jgi:anti-sigma factor RsiW